MVAIVLIRVIMLSRVPRILRPVLQVVPVISAEVDHIRVDPGRSHSSILGLSSIIHLLNLVVLLIKAIELSLVRGMVPFLEPPVVLAPPIEFVFRASVLLTRRAWSEVGAHVLNILLHLPPKKRGLFQRVLVFKVRGLSVARIVDLLISLKSIV